MLNQNGIVVEQKVHSPLYSKFLAEERRFEQNFLYVERLYALFQRVSYGISDVLLLSSCLFVKRAVEFAARCKVYGILLEESVYAVLVSHILVEVVNLLIEELSGKISKKNVFRVWIQFYLIQQILLRAVSVTLEARCNLRDVDKVVWLEND